MQNHASMNTRNLVFVGILTWTIVAATHLRGALALPPLDRLAFFASFVAFLSVFWFATRDWCKGPIALTLLAAQSLLALTAIATGPSGFLPVLLVIVAGQLGQMPISRALLWITAQSAILGALVQRKDAVAMTLAYFTFQLFGAFAARIVQEERDARQQLAEANAELRVATGLLDISSRAEERVRIARELHDLLGHHLTALSLNLEVASHLAQGEAREQIAKSQALTKLLLSDVRDSVSRLRGDEPVDLAAALQSICEVVTEPAIHVDAGEIGVTEAAAARTALRAVQEIVTNSVRHSGARNLWLTVSPRENGLAIDARDDGRGTDHVRFGNGLRGMRERVQQSGGTLDVASMRGRGFEVHILLPAEART